MIDMGEIMMEIVTEYSPHQEDSILELLKDFDAEFVPRLSQRIDLLEYAKKLAQNAVWFLAYDEGNIIGHCAAYMNRPEYAYISSIAVKKKVRLRGIGDCIWECVEREAVNRGMQSILLEVRRTNITGIRFYQKHVCSILSLRGEWMTMKKDLSTLY